MDQTNTARDPESVARSYLRAFETGDADTVADHVSDGFINEHTAGLGRGCVGKRAYRERLPAFLAEMVDLRYEIESLVVQDPNVAAFYTMTARWQGDTPITVRGVQRLTVLDGVVTHRVDYWDSAVFLGQVSEDARKTLRGFGIG